MPPKKVSVAANAAANAANKDKPKRTKKIEESKAVDVIPIVLESPNKIKKIISFLPRGKYIVLASCGHFRELSSAYNGMGFSVDDTGVQLEYLDDPKKKSVISNLKNSCKGCKVVYLATDPDREGEAIAWHITELLGKNRDYYRIKFNSITRNEVLKALDNPTRIDMNLVLAQQTRKIIDKWIGFKVSPLCWSSISKLAKSAGRVQSPALKLLVDREREVIHFKSTEYYTITAKYNFSKDCEIPLHNYLDMKKPLYFSSEDETMAAISKIEELCKSWSLTISEDLSNSNPPPPYTTLTMLQDCHTYLKMNPEHAMAALQKMYESGWITYHRTDSVVLSTEGLFGAREALEAQHPELLSEKPRNYTNKTLNAQEAHEPIRPTHFEIVNLDKLLDDSDKAKLDPRIIKIYSMIYFRTIATQCRSLVNTNITFTYNSNECKEVDFVKTFSYLKDLGWKTLYSDKNINLFYSKTLDGPEKVPKWITDLQKVKGSMACNLEEFGLETHHTIPPPLFTSSTLIKELEHLGIGRPSTYAGIVSKLFDNRYIYEKDSKLHPTAVGMELVDFLEGRYKEHFMNLEYTQKMEQRLDHIAEGKYNWDTSVREFVTSFPV